MQPRARQPDPADAIEARASSRFDLPTADDAVLDQFFDDATAALQDGREIAFAGIPAGRDDLLPRLERLADLARFVASTSTEHAPRIDGYTILSELGRGGMAAVYLARQERLGGRPVALKVLPREAALSLRARERFRAESLAVARQKHPGIVPVYDIIDDGSTLAYAMEWVDGRTLEDVVAGLREALGGSLAGGRDDRRAIALVRALADAPAGAFPDAAYSALVARIGLTAARALHAVHQTGLLHRDVKPSNLLLRRDGAVLLSDFGLARDLDSVTATTGESFLGTAPYSAPEQLRAQRDLLDARSDVYSLGASLYHALALHPPFTSRSPVEVLSRLENVGPSPLRLACPATPGDLCTIIAKAMDPDPARRYQTAAAMADDLQRFLEDRPILARPPTVALRAWKFVRRNRAVLATGALVASVVIALAAGIVTREFYFPRWAQVSLDQARTSLLGRAHGFEMYNHAFFGSKTPSVWPASVDRLQVAADAYDRVLSFDSTIAAARVERDVLRAIIRRSRPGPNADDQPFLADYPLTAAYLSVAKAQPDSKLTRQMAEGESLLPDAQQASTADLRALGLAALTLMDTSTAVDAWSELERREGDDPFVAAALGMLYVCEERYPMAYPRLRDAVRAYPRSGMLKQFAAEAAWGCGDIIKARQYLDGARDLPEQDDRADYRLRTLLSLTEGPFDVVIDRYRRDMAGPYAVRFNADNSILQYQLGREFERRGDLAMAAHFYAFGTGGTWCARRASRVFLPAARRWWAGLDEAGRRSALGVVFDGRGWWSRGAAWGPFIAYPNCETRWPMPTDPQEAAPAEHLAGVCRRMGDDCGGNPEALPTTGDPAEQAAIIAWWMTGENRPAFLPPGP